MSPTPTPLSPAGLCSSCRHARTVASARATYLRCSRSDTDIRYERYPRLPILACGGFEASRQPESRKP